MVKSLTMFNVAQNNNENNSKMNGELGPESQTLNGAHKAPRIGQAETEQPKDNRLESAMERQTITSGINHTVQAVVPAAPFADDDFLPRWSDVDHKPVMVDETVSSVPPTLPNSAEVVSIASVTDPLTSIAQERLQELQAGWSSEKLDEWLVERYLSLLANWENLSKEDLRAGLGMLRARLKEAGYQPKRQSEYQKICKKLYQDQQHKAEASKSELPAKQSVVQQLACRYCIRGLTQPGADNPKFVNAMGERLPNAPPFSAFQTEGIYDLEMSDFLSNFTVTIHEEITVQDQFEQRKVFKGVVRLFGKDHPLEIDAQQFADNNQLKAAIIGVAGASAVIFGKMDALRQAISLLNHRPGIHQPLTRTVTTDFGWNAEGTEFLVPSGRITVDGFLPVNDQTDTRVELNEELARQLDLQPIADSSELRRVKQHIIDDLLHLHDRCVTRSLLAAVGVAVLHRFTEVSPFTLWLVGRTGAGKSYLAKLFMNFFSKNILNAGAVASWSSTPNYLQRTGYFFKDALFLIDDYKPELIKHEAIVRLLQNYADGTGRGRLKCDATTNTSRPIRGLLMSTGEDVPEHTASALARSIIINVPQQEKDLRRGHRCSQESSRYRGVMADMVQQFLKRGRLAVFPKMVRALQEYYYRDIAGKENDSRIANNFALLAAGFVAVARYFADVWPNWKAEVGTFLTQDLKVIRDEMVGAAKEQQASEVFWSVLQTLIAHEVVAIENQSGDKGKVVIGKPLYKRADATQTGPHDLYCISTDLALAQVNICLREQGRPDLKVTAGTLLDQLRFEGRLFSEDGQPLTIEGSSGKTKQVRIDGKARRGFVTRKSVLVPSDQPEGSAQRSEQKTPITRS